MRTLNRQLANKFNISNLFHSPPIGDSESQEIASASERGEERKEEKA